MAPAAPWYPAASGRSPAAIAARAGFDEDHGNELLVADGKLTGKVAEPILGRTAKSATLAGLINTLGLDPAETVAVGDGANDIDMLKAAGLGVAFRAKASTEAAADAALRHADLTGLLFLQGYRRSEFVSPGTTAEAGSTPTVCAITPACGIRLLGLVRRLRPRPRPGR